MRSLRQAGATDAAAELCADITKDFPEAAWAQQQLGFLALGQGRAEEAVTALQGALRRNPGNAPAWEALGAAYHTLGRLTAALKVDFVLESARDSQVCAFSHKSSGVPCWKIVKTMQSLLQSWLLTCCCQ